VDDHISNEFKIETSVPQGAILSPILFLIYINDIIQLNKYPNEKITSLLFADDLFSFNSDKNLNILRSQAQRYLDHLEVWLNKWRLTIAANKCSFNIYSRGNCADMIKKGNFKLHINKEDIPIEVNPRYLGVILDKNMNLNKQADILNEKCTKLLNIIKCLTFKKWSMSVNNQLKVYKTLIRSNMEYAAPLIIMSQYNINKLNGIQYNALRLIHKEAPGVSSTYLHDLSEIKKVKERLVELSRNYIVKAIEKSNPLLMKLFSEVSDLSLEYKSPINALN